MVENAARRYSREQNVSTENWTNRIKRVVVTSTSIQVSFGHDDAIDSQQAQTTDIPWTPKNTSNSRTSSPSPDGQPDQKLLQSIVRAHAWLNDLSSGRHSTIEQLANTAKLHPKVVRQGLRLAFLAPAVTSAIIDGAQPASLASGKIPKLLPLCWSKHRQLLEPYCQPL